MKPEHAKQLITLIREIDVDHPKDFIDSVCAARDAISTEAEHELAADAFGCEVYTFSSRCCEMGTRSCIKVHNAKVSEGENER